MLQDQSEHEDLKIAGTKIRTSMVTVVLEKNSTHPTEDMLVGLLNFASIINNLGGSRSDFYALGMKMYYVAAERDLGAEQAAELFSDMFTEVS
jgi:hypothetical protein